jgi:hypothetical protein
MALFFREWRRRRNAIRKFVRLYHPMGQFVPEDVFIVGYPKSGNTWFQDLVTMVIYGVPPSLSPPLLAQTMVPDVHSRPFFQRYSTPMFFKSHFLPRPEYRRVVYLIRDGRDAMVSHYHHFKAFGEDVSLMEMISNETKVPHGAWHKHVNAWLSNPYQAEMIVIKYEDLKTDPFTALENFCAFAGVKRSRSLLETVARETVFYKMQRREMRLGEGDPEWPKDKLFRRRGVIGSYKDEMPENVLAAFMAQASDTLRKCGYLDEPKEFIPRPEPARIEQPVHTELALTNRLKVAPQAAA